MKKVLLPAMLIISTLGAPLMANDPHVGFALGLGFPIGEFKSRYFEDISHRFWSDSYDTGIGGQFWLSFPTDQKVAFRLNLGGMSTNGRAMCSNGDYRNLRHQVFSLGGDLQLFTENAYRHKGLYFIGGLSADFERFDESLYDIQEDYPMVTSRKSRLGGNFGIGHSFSFASGLRFTVEGVYHKTLTGTNRAVGDPIATDSLRTNFGLVF